MKISSNFLPPSCSHGHVYHEAVSVTGNRMYLLEPDICLGLNPGFTTIDLEQVTSGLNLNSFVNKMGMIVSSTWI